MTHWGPQDKVRTVKVVSCPKSIKPVPYGHSFPSREPWQKRVSALSEDSQVFAVLSFLALKNSTTNTNGIRSASISWHPPRLCEQIHRANIFQRKPTRKGEADKGKDARRRNPSRFLTVITATHILKDLKTKTPIVWVHFLELNGQWCVVNAPYKACSHCIVKKCRSFLCCTSYETMPQTIF